MFNHVQAIGVGGHECKHGSGDIYLVDNIEDIMLAPEVKYAKTWTSVISVMVAGFGCLKMMVALKDRVAQAYHLDLRKEEKLIKVYPSHHVSWRR